MRKKRLRKYGLVLAACLWPTVLAAQGNEFGQAYEQFRQQARQDYENFRDEANRRYADFMRQAWQLHRQLPAIPRPEDKEMPPVVKPESDNDTVPHDRPVRIDEDVVTVPPPQPQPVPVAPIREQPTPEERVTTIRVYGTDFRVRVSPDAPPSLASLDGPSLAQAWEMLSGRALNNTIRDCLELRIRHQLSDWAYLKILDRLAATCCESTNEATLLMAYIYCQSGYKMRLAMSGGRLYMLYASLHAVYDQSCFQIDGEQFYVYGASIEQLHVCEAAFPGEKPLSFFIAGEQLFDADLSEPRALTSTRYPEVRVQTKVNKNLIAFYNDYPMSHFGDDVMTRWATCANTPLDAATRETLYPALANAVARYGQREAVNRLLNFMHTAFVYEYDDKVWGHDRSFFAEETLFYPYCDCEDRAIFLSRLVRDLLHLRVILVYYPGHLAMAVRFTEPVQGDYILLGGERYVVCDPTYIGAPVGETMPGMDNQTAKVILLEE